MPNTAYIEFATPNNGNNFLVPLVDVDGNTLKDQIPELPEAAKNAISDYYSTVLPTELPSDPFIRYYYVSLSIIGLYVVYRMLMTGRDISS